MLIKGRNGEQLDVDLRLTQMRNPSVEKAALLLMDLARNEEINAVLCWLYYRGYRQGVEDVNSVYAPKSEELRAKDQRGFYNGGSAKAERSVLTGPVVQGTGTGPYFRQADTI